MRELETSLTQKGQVTIPAEIRSRLGLKPRDKVIFELADDSVRLRPAASRVRQHYGSVRPIHKPEDFGSLRGAFEQGVAQEVSGEEK